jgi:cytochrome b pre-mRNA-processing protein 3
MFSNYKTHYNLFYNKLVELSRNIFFYKNTLLKDDFETRINLIFIHFSIILLIFKKRKKNFPQEIFDNTFLNIEFHIRELGYGDVTVNKKMKTLTRIFYDILLKINKSKTEAFKSNDEILKTYFSLSDDDKYRIIDNLSEYFDSFYNFCFELKGDIMLKGQINFKHLNKHGSS